MKKYRFIILLALLAPFRLLAQPSMPSAVQDRIKSVEMNLAGPIQIEGRSKWNLEERMAFYKTPGLTLAVVHDFKIDWAKGYGWADVKEKRKVTVATLFQAASVSKSLNAVGVLKLAQDRKIDLNADINNYLTSWKFPYDTLSHGKKITITNLLSHTAGLTVDGFGGYSQGETLPTVQQILDGKKPANSDAVRSMMAPDTRVEYSGGGTTISQCIVTDVTHLAYADFMWSTVLKPLGMTNSFYNQPPPESKAALLATAYRADGKPIPGKFYVYPEQAAAGLWTNPTDLANYVIDTQRSLQGKSNKVLSQSSTKLRLTPYRDAAGLGVFLTSHASDTYFEHSGGNEGFRCIYMGNTTNGNGVVIMVNSDNGNIIPEILNSVATVYGWKDFYNPTVKKIVLLPSSQLKRLEGYYELRDDAKLHLQLRTRGSQLILKQLWDGQEITFESESELSFFCKEFPFPLKFSKNAAGEITEVLAFDRDVWKKVNDFVPGEK